MKRILCYGDSNTWGYMPVTGLRYSETERWTGRLATRLGDQVHLIEEGLNGRTTAFTDHIEPYRNGLDYAAPCILSHAPLDLIILMLGTNDSKLRYHVPASEIADGMENLIRRFRFYYPDAYPFPPILLVAPVPLKEMESEPSFDRTSAEKLRKLPALYEELAKRSCCHYFNAQEVITEKHLGKDGLHLTPEGHQILADALFKIVQTFIFPLQTDHVF